MEILVRSCWQKATTFYEARGT